MACHALQSDRHRLNQRWLRSCFGCPQAGFDFAPQFLDRVEVRRVGRAENESRRPPLRSKRGSAGSCAGRGCPRSPRRPGAAWGTGRGGHRPETPPYRRFPRLPCRRLSHPVATPRSGWWFANDLGERWRGRADPAAHGRTSGSGWSWHPTRQGRSTWRDRSPFGSAAMCGARGRYPGGLARWRGASFFICQPHLRQGVVDGRQ